MNSEAFSTCIIQRGQPSVCFAQTCCRFYSFVCSNVTSGMYPNTWSDTLCVFVDPSAENVQLMFVFISNHRQVYDNYSAKRYTFSWMWKELSAAHIRFHVTSSDLVGYVRTKIHTMEGNP